MVAASYIDNYFVMADNSYIENDYDAAAMPLVAGYFSMRGLSGRVGIIFFILDMTITVNLQV